MYLLKHTLATINKKIIKKKQLTGAVDDAEVDDGGWNGIGIGGINGGMTGGIKPIGGGMKPTYVHAIIKICTY